MTPLPGCTVDETRALVKWFAAARAALSGNCPLTATATAIPERASHDLTAEEVVFHSAGALEDDTPSRVRNDPLIKSQAQYMTLLEESLSAAQAAKLLGVDVSRVRQRLRDRSLFGVEHDSTWRLPRFQFERRRVIPGLARVLKALPEGLLPLDLVDWFVSPDAGLQLESEVVALSPREWLVSGRPVEAVLAAVSELVRP